MVTSYFVRWLALGLVAFTSGSGFSAVIRARRAPTTSTTDTIRTYDSPAVFLTVAPAVLVMEGDGLPGLNFQLSTRIVRDVPLYLTADVGPFFHNTSYTFRVVVPILFGMDYQVEIAGSAVKPIFGVNLGPVVGSRVVFGMLFRPGVNIAIGRNISLNFEPRLGVIANSFAFMPQFGARFAL